MTIQPRWYESNLMVGALLLVLGGLVLYTIFEDKSLPRSKAEQTILKLGGKLDRFVVERAIFSKSYTNVSYGVPVRADQKQWTRDEALGFAEAVATLNDLQSLTLCGDALCPGFLKKISREHRFRKAIFLSIYGPVEPKNLSFEEIQFPFKIGLARGAATDELLSQLFANPNVQEISFTDFAPKNLSIPKVHGVEKFFVSSCDTSPLFTDEFLRDWSNIRRVAFIECRTDARDLMKIFQSKRPEDLQVEFEVTSSGEPLSLGEVRKLYEDLAPWAQDKESHEQDLKGLRLIDAPEKFSVKLMVDSGGYISRKNEALLFHLKLSTLPGIKLSPVEFEALEQLSSDIQVNDCEVEEQTIAPND